MKKSTKKVVSIVLAASMMFTSVAATPTFAAANSEITAYAAFSGTASVDANAVNEAVAAAGLFGVGDAYDMGNGVSSVNGGSEWEAKGNSYTYTDGTSTTGAFQIGKGNKTIAAGLTAGTVLGADAVIEKALKFESAGTGTFTLYAGIGSSGIFTTDVLLIDAATNTVVQNFTLTKDETTNVLTPVVLDIPAAGTYYILSPANATSINVARIDLNITASAEVPTETTTEAPTETSTEAPTETSTEAPTETTTEAPAPVTGFAGQGSINANDVNTAITEAGLFGVGDAYDFGTGFVSVNKGSEWEAKGNSYDYTDGTSTTGAFQIGKGNKTIAAGLTAGTVLGADAVIEKALQFNSAGTGTVTLYAGIGSSSVDSAEILLIDAATNTVLENVSLTKTETGEVTEGGAAKYVLNPVVLNIPAAGSYYILNPNNATSLNIALINVDITASEVPTETTTDAEVPTETTTAEVTTEPTTEAPTYSADTILAQPVAPEAVAQNGHNAVDKEVGETFNVNIDLSNVENTSGINNYTFFVTYNPDVVKMTGIVEATQENIDSYVTYPITVAGMELAQTLYDVNKINQSIALTPAADEENFADYADVLTSDTSLTATCADLGKVKFSNYIGDSSSDGSLVVATKSGTLLTLSFEVVGTGDTEIAVDLTYPTIDGFKSNPTSGVAIKSAAIAGNIWIEDVIETTETTTETTSETTSETTTAEPTESTETTTAVVTETTTEATETTTRRSSSSGGGGGGSSSDKASNQASDDETEVTTDEVTEPTTRASFTITNSNGQEITITPPVEGTYSVNFTDISHRPWAVSAIERLASAGIINGVSATSFAPDAYSKRADFVIMIVNTLGLTGTATSNFTDVYAGKYYYNAVGLGYEAGIVSGYGDGTFGPEKYCTREEMMVLVAQTFAFLGADISADESVLDKYGDEASISWWARPYVAYLTATGVATGTGTNIEPSVYITRAQMAVMVEKIYDYVLDLADEAAAQATTVEETTEETTEDVTSDEDTTEETTSDEDTTEETTVDEDATETTTEEEE